MYSDFILSSDLESCELIPSVCLNGGTCVGSGIQYNCRCTTQFSGEHCEGMNGGYGWWIWIKWNHFVVVVYFFLSAWMTHMFFVCLNLGDSLLSGCTLYSVSIQYGPTALEDSTSVSVTLLRFQFRNTVLDSYHAALTAVLVKVWATVSPASVAWDTVETTAAWVCNNLTTAV